MNAAKKSPPNGCEKETQANGKDLDLDRALLEPRIIVPGYGYRTDEVVVVALLVKDEDNVFGIEHKADIGRVRFQDPYCRWIARAALRHLEEYGEVDYTALAVEVADSQNATPAEIERFITDVLYEFATLGRPKAERSLANLLELDRKLNWQNAARDLVRIADDHNATSEEIAAAAMAMTEARAADAGERGRTLHDTMATDPADESLDLIRTGNDWFDGNLPDGGLRRGDTLGLSARPGVGKTTLTLQLALGVLLEDPEANVVWGLGEMHEKQLRNRSLSNLSGLTTGLLRRPWDELSEYQAKKKRGAIETLEAISPRFHLVPSPLTPATLELRIAATGAVLCPVDYLQLCRLDRGGDGSRRDEIDGVIREFVRISKAHNVAMILISNMPKGNGGPVDVYSAFKESSEIAHAVDLAYTAEVLGEDLHGDVPPDEVDIRLRCLKSRNGTPKSILTQFNRPGQSFRGMGR